MSQELKPCPFCGEAMKVSPHPVDMWAVCPTAGCIGARQIVVLEDNKQVAAWNRRASPPEDVRREALEEAAKFFESEPHRERFGSSVADELRELANKNAAS